MKIDLTQHTIGSLADELIAQGITVEYIDPGLASLSAQVLITGSSGDQDQSNGDHIYGFTSLLWAYLSAVATELNLARCEIIQMLRQMEIPTAEDIWLDHLGGYYKVPRLAGEPDSQYGPRIIAETLMPKGNNYAISKAIEHVTGQRCDVTDVVSAITAPARYYDETYLYDGSIDHSGGGASGIYRCLFDVAVGFDLLGSSLPGGFSDQVIAQVNRLRDAGTFLRSINLTASSDMDDDAVSDAGDDLTITVTMAAYYDGTFRHNGLIGYGGAIGTPESI